MPIEAVMKAVVDNYVAIESNKFLQTDITVQINSEEGKSLNSSSYILRSLPRNIQTPPVNRSTSGSAYSPSSSDDESSDKLMPDHFLRVAEDAVKKRYRSLSDSPTVEWKNAHTINNQKHTLFQSQACGKEETSAALEQQLPLRQKTVK
jgi:hypothetical protein